MSLKGFAKSGLLAAVSKMTGRHAVLLPPEAGDEESILNLSAPYRVEGDSLRVTLLEPESGALRVTLLGYEGHFPTKPLWSGIADYRGPDELWLGVRSGEIGLGEKRLGSVPLPLPTRRFCFRLELDTGGRRRHRLTGHYLASHGNGSYFNGDNYVDYEAEARGDVPRVLELFKKYHARGPVLEIGCATGVVLAALAETGLECYGVDLSSWAVEKARTRVGESNVYVADVEKDGLSEAVRGTGPFRTLLLWAVLEHFHEPFRVLADLTRNVSPGAVLFINTTNARSLNRLLFGAEWEGYFDTSHHGVDAVSPDTLRTELPRLGWRIDELETHLSWDSSTDPTRAAVREWWAADARFRRLLTELDRGDLVSCVAHLK
ncbi:MAG: class I SAM-dependent methyltransferase [Vicinamibacteria bacterium]